jgi:hypothetical protein
LKKPYGKNLKIYILYACAKFLKPSGKIGEDYNIEMSLIFLGKTLAEKNQ